jgi:putative transposase
MLFFEQGIGDLGCVWPRSVKNCTVTWSAPDLSDFAWQGGYGIFSIGFSQAGSVRDYIAAQEEHTRKTSFQDELRLLLRRYEIEFEERYVWG